MSDNERPVHEAARAQINKALGRYGWKFVESCMAGPVTVKYTIERESDGRRASAALGIEELTMNILDDVFHEPLAAAGVKLEVSMYLLLTLVRLAKSENARKPRVGDHVRTADGSFGVVKETAPDGQMLVRVRGVIVPPTGEEES